MAQIKLLVKMQTAMRFVSQQQFGYMQNSNEQIVRYYFNGGIKAAAGRPISFFIQRQLLKLLNGNF
jgi:hypothetical protein